MSALPPLALAYHGVAAVPLRHDPWRLFVAPDRVRRHVVALRRWGYELVTFGALARRVADGEAAGLAALTFDDGLADNLTALAPLLVELDAPATVFVVSGWSGDRHPDAPTASLLDDEGVRALHLAGIEIGSHGVQHRDLTTLSYEGALDELCASRSALEAVIDAPVTVAAYPFGAADGDVRRACADAGYLAACRTAGDGRWDDPYDLPRQRMANGASIAGLRLKRVGRYERVMQAPLATWPRRMGRWWRVRADVRRAGARRTPPPSVPR
jgi:peptidoglycan/xylan/chitin deacetylase (PgdA/CDA1 family)